MKRLIYVFFLILIVNTYTIADNRQSIKLATLAPEGSTWMEVMREFEKSVTKETNKRIQFRMFPGGVSGAEADVVRKLRFGQLDGAGLTGAGLGLIVPEERILDSAFLFNNENEIDEIYEQFTPEIDQLFNKKGFIVLGWAEVGTVYLFTKTKVSSLADLQKLRLWSWEGDPLAASIFSALKIQPIPLQVADVFTALQTGLIDGVYSPPLAMIALQWFTQINYYLNIPLGNASGAIIISEKKFNALNLTDQEILRENGSYYMSELQNRSRTDNSVAIEVLKERGVSAINLNLIEEQKIRTAGSKSRQALVSKLYPQELLTRIELAVSQMRN